MRLRARVRYTACVACQPLKPGDLNPKGDGFVLAEPAYCEMHANKLVKKLKAELRDTVDALDSIIASLKDKFHNGAWSVACCTRSELVRKYPWTVPPSSEESKK